MSRSFAYGGIILVFVKMIMIVMMMMIITMMMIASENSISTFVRAYPKLFHKASTTDCVDLIVVDGPADEVKVMS